MIKKITLILASLFISIVLNFILMLVITISVSSVSSSSLRGLAVISSLLFFPIIYIGVYRLIRKKELQQFEKESDIKYFDFSQNLKVRSNKTVASREIYTISKEFIKKKKISIAIDISMLAPIYLLSASLLYVEVSILKATLITIALTTLGVLVTFFYYKKILTETQEFYVKIDSDLVLINQKGIKQQFNMIDIKKIKVKNKQNTKCIEYIELFLNTTNVVRQTDIRLYGYNRMDNLLENLRSAQTNGANS